MKRRDVWNGVATLIVICLGLAVVFVLSVQGRSGAQQNQPDYDEDFMKMMHPVELARRFVTDDKLPQQIATFKWKLYQEYQAKGFREDQALQLVMSGGIPFSASE